MHIYEFIPATISSSLNGSILIYLGVLMIKLHDNVSCDSLEFSLGILYLGDEQN